MANLAVTAVRMAEPSQLATIRQMIDEVSSHIFGDFSYDEAQALIRAEDKFVVDIARAFEPYISNKPPLHTLVEMEQFYWEVFGLIKTDYFDLRIPLARDGFPWLLVIDERVTIDLAFQVAATRFPCWKYTERSLDSEFPTSDDGQNKTHAIWLRDGEEADEVHKNKSTFQLENEGVVSIRLKARIILELWYHWKYGQHLDVNTWTLVAGSRHRDGSRPYCYWDGERFKVFWCRPAEARSCLRVREVVC